MTAPVYDSVTGDHLLIPQGARLIGTYDSQTTHGDNRLLLVWNRLILPNGWSINLEEMEAADPTGASGLQGPHGQSSVRPGRRDRHCPRSSASSATTPRATIRTASARALATPPPKRRRRAAVVSWIVISPSSQRCAFGRRARTRSGYARHPSAPVCSCICRAPRCAPRVAHSEAIRWAQLRSRSHEKAARCGAARSSSVRQNRGATDHSRYRLLAYCWLFGFRAAFRCIRNSAGI